MGLGAASLSAVAAFLLTTALTIFTLFFAVAFTIAHSGWYQLGIAAAALDVLDLACLACYFLWASGKRQGLDRDNRLRGVTLIAVPVAFAASHALSLALLICMQRQPSKTSATVFGERIKLFLQTAWALWGASLVAQMLLIAVWTMRKSRQLNAQNTIYANTQARISELWAPPTPGSLHIFSPPYSSHSTISSTAPSTLYAEQKGLLRFAPRSTGFGPISSSTRLTLSPNISERELTPLSSSANKQGDNAGRPTSNSTSAAESTPQFPPRPTTPVRQRLEPIPGSQPNSPGKPLDGPFQQQRHNEAATEPAKISPTYSVTSPEPERGRNPTRIPPRFRKDSAASQSQPTSPVIDESHIHPLFRSDSPLPPPTPTLGSTITASAFGGQYMGRSASSRASSRSGVGSTETLTLPGSRRRSGSLGASFKSTSPHPLIKRARSLGTVKPMTESQESHKANLSLLSVISDSTSQISHETNSLYGTGHQTGIVI